MKPLHLLLVHQAFASPNEAGGTRHFELGQHWVAAGNRFTVITSDRNHLSGELISNTAAHDTAIQIQRVYTMPTLHRSFVWRVVSFLSFSFTSLVAGLRTRNVDVVMGTTPPMPQAPTAWLIAALKRKPFLLEVRDLWPEFAIDMGVLKNKLVIWIARRLESFLYARADHILVNSPAYRDYLVQKKQVPAAKVSLIANGVDPAPFQRGVGDAVRARLGVNGEFIVMYAGALGMANDVHTVLEAARRLKDDREIKFVLVGDGKERRTLERHAQEARLDNVIFAGAQPKTAMPAHLAAADCCIAVLQNIPMFTTTYPNKVFDYMAAGKPTVLAIDGVIRDVIERAAGGVFVSPGDPAAMANAISQLRHDRAVARKMGMDAQKYVAANFNRATQAEHFIELVSGMVKQ